MPRRPTQRFTHALMLATVLALAACSKTPPPPSPAQIEALRPADPQLAALYERSCMICHARGGSGAPQVGDVAAWQPRLAKGRDALLRSVQQGLNAMPAMGLCSDCKPQELAALIDFISTPPQEAAR